MLFGDAQALRVAYARRDAREIVIEALSAGTWILANDRIGSPEFPKSARAAELSRDLATATDLVTSGRRLLADHELPPLDVVPSPPHGSPYPHEFLQQLQAICIHTPVYGTRSAALVAIGPKRVEHYLVADGPSCVTAFREWAPLLST